ncbi:hypothetical protein MMC25_000429 [Agyrium rufum]|nr:hypothetical protein [Agyrium rufum]
MLTLFKPHLEADYSSESGAGTVRSLAALNRQAGCGVNRDTASASFVWIMTPAKSTSSEKPPGVDNVDEAAVTAGTPIAPVAPTATAQPVSQDTDAKKQGLSQDREAQKPGLSQDGEMRKPELSQAAPPPQILYRREYKNKNGEIVASFQEDDPAKLLPKIDLSTVIEVLVTVSAPTDKKASDVKPTTATPSDASGTSTASTAQVPEGFERSFTQETQLIIRSEKLLNSLRAVVTYSPGKTLLGRDISFPEPYQLLVHHQEDLEQYKSQHPPYHSPEYQRECNEHIDVLLKYLKETTAKGVEAERRRHAQEPPMCTFEHLWLLHKSGEICYKTLDDRLDPHVTATSTGGIVKGQPTKYSIACWNIDFDGYDVGQEKWFQYIHPFDGEREIRELDYYPARFHKDDDQETERNGGLTKREQHVVNGKKWWKLVEETVDIVDGAYHIEYDGQTMTPPFKKITGRQVVDPLSYYAQYVWTDSTPIIMRRPSLDGAEYTDSDYGAQGGQGVSGSSGCECPTCASLTNRKRLGKYQWFHKIDPKKQQPPDDPDFYLLCSSRVFVYLLRERQWDALHVQHIEEVVIKKTAFDNLVLEQSIKDTVEALSRSFSTAKGTSMGLGADFIQGKGEGRIFLLHGPPGVGKTATAEAVAEMTGRPLLALTSGDLGTSAEKVEQSLRRYLGYGEIWGAVVLIDEADIYLERRQLTDIKRNGLVSVFLRALEYYRGLLFLTSNRVDTFDEAFTSRIHVSLHYKKLNDKDRRQIWINGINRFKSENIKVTKQARDYVCENSAVSSLEWNGREIRNGLQTAVALADFKAADRGDNPLIVRQEHFEEVVKLAGKFKRYLQLRHGGISESMQAKRDGLRNESYEDPPKKSSSFATGGSSKSGQTSSTRRKQPEPEEETYEEEDEQDVHVTKKGKAKSKKNPPPPPPEEEDDEDEDEEEVQLPKRSKTRSTGKKVVVSTAQAEDGDEEDEEEQVVAPRSKAKRPARRASSKEKVEEEVEKARPTRRKVTPQPPVEEEEEGDEDDEDENEDEEEEQRPTRKAGRR